MSSTALGQSIPCLSWLTKHCTPPLKYFFTIDVTPSVWTPEIIFTNSGHHLFYTELLSSGYMMIFTNSLRAGMASSWKRRLAIHGNVLVIFINYNITTILYWQYWHTIYHHRYHQYMIFKPDEPDKPNKPDLTNLEKLMVFCGDPVALPTLLQTLWDDLA